MPEYEITDHGNGTYTVRDVSYGDVGVSFVSLIIGYAIAFIGMLIMLFQVPSSFLFPAILAMLLFLLPIAVAVFKRTSVMGALGSIAKHSYLFFNLLIAMWWVLFSLGSTNGPLLVGIAFTTMYAMYYFPVLLIYDSARRDTSIGCLGMAICGIASLVTYLIFYANIDSFPRLGDYIPIVFSTAMTVSGSLMLFVNRAIYFFRHKSIKGIIHLVLYILAVALIAVSTATVIPAYNQENYRLAKMHMEAGRYREAREMLRELDGYLDAAELLASIEYVDLKVGEVVTFGRQAKTPENYRTYVDLEWTVIAVEDGKAVLFSNAILTTITSNPLSRWNEGNNVRNELGEIFDCFEEADQGRVVPTTLSIETEKGTLTATDNLYLLTKAELTEYCRHDFIYSGDDTSFNDHVCLELQRSGYVNYELAYNYYLRETDDKGNWMIVDCDEDVVCKINNNYVGIRPAVTITMDTAPQESTAE